MKTRTLGTSVLIKKNPLDPFNRNIPDKRDVRDAVAQITKELKDMAATHHPAGWSEDGYDVAWSITGIDDGNVILGTLQMSRPD